MTEGQRNVRRLFTEVLEMKSEKRGIMLIFLMTGMERIKIT